MMTISSLPYAHTQKNSHAVRNYCQTCYDHFHVQAFILSISFQSWIFIAIWFCSAAHWLPFLNSLLPSLFNGSLLPNPLFTCGLWTVAYFSHGFLYILPTVPLSYLRIGKSSWWKSMSGSTAFNSLITAPCFSAPTSRFSHNIFILASSAHQLLLSFWPTKYPASDCLYFSLGCNYCSSPLMQTYLS